jgi:hypothetical protein
LNKKSSKKIFSKFGELKSSPNFYKANAKLHMAIILEEVVTSGTSLAEPLVEMAKGRAPKKAKEEDLDDDEEEVAPKKGGKKAAEDDDEDDDDEDGEPEEGDDDWDPDFEEFDLPKSRKGKADKEEEEEDFKVEEEEDFKDLDLFNDGGFDEEEEDY